MVFLLNPYDTTLDLANREDRKLFNEACKGLADNDKFAGKREDCNAFLKLLERSFEGIRVMEALEITTEWDDSITDANLANPQHFNVQSTCTSQTD